VERSLLRGAVAGRLAAAGVEFVDGALDELAQREQLVELALVLGQQGFEGQAQAAPESPQAADFCRNPPSREPTARGGLFYCLNRSSKTFSGSGDSTLIRSS
jgi:hypothetical protein